MKTVNGLLILDEEKEHFIDAMKGPDVQNNIPDILKTRKGTIIMQ